MPPAEQRRRCSYRSLEAISYNKLTLKTENGGFSTFAGVFDPGTGRIGPAVLKFRVALLRDASNGVGRFFRIAKKKNPDTPQVPQNQFRLLFMRK